MASIPLLTQLLDNLVQNALHYSPIGTPVEVRVVDANGFVEIGVCDQGVGISPDEQHRVFEPFYRASAAQQLGVIGSGLGLPVARRIARALGGRLEYRSNPTAGCTFLLALPTYRDEQTAVPAPAGT
jgi:signal transduction histidine kinase